MLLYDRAILCLSTLNVFGVYYGYIPTRFKKKRGHLIIVHVFQHFFSNTKGNTNVRLCRFLCLFNLLPWKTTTLIYETALQCTWTIHGFKYYFSERLLSYSPFQILYQILIHEPSTCLMLICVLCNLVQSITSQSMKGFWKKCSPSRDN